MESECTQDEKTVLLDRESHGPAQGPLTDFPSPPRYEQLEDRMIYAGLRLDTQSFQVGLNPIVDAAWAVLSEVVGLRRCSGRESWDTLKERLSLAVNQFETHALQGGVESSQIISARYVLCSVIDEAVLITPWGAQSEWSKKSLLSRFHNETFGGEKFSNCWSGCRATPSSTWRCWSFCTCVYLWGSRVNTGSWSGARHNLRLFVMPCIARSGMYVGNR